MTKQDLVTEVGKACELTKKEADAAVTVILEKIGEALENGEEVKLTGFGNFAVKTKKARTGTIPGTGEKIDIPERKVVTFKPSKQLKEAVK